MTKLAFQRILFLAGVTTLFIGLYIGSQSTIQVSALSIVSIVVIAAGAYMAIVGAVALLGSGEPDPDAEKVILPDVSVALLYGGFIAVISIVPAMVVAHYADATKGILTFILAFVVANAVFGLPLALARAAAGR